MKALVSQMRAFAREEYGVALTEYLVLLGLLVGGVVVAVGMAGTNLAAAWQTWADWFVSDTAGLKKA